MKGTRNIYNTEPLLNEIENVVKNGLDKILSKTLQRYELLERTHKQLMNLPSIKEEIGNMNSDSSDESESDDEYTPIINKNQSNNDLMVANSKIDNLISSHSIAKLDIVNIEAKLDRLEKKYAGLYPMLDKILDKIENLNNDVQKIKSNATNDTITIVAAEPTIIASCQNENIKFEIKEEEQIKIVNIGAPVLQTKEESVTVSKADESECESEDVEDDSEAVEEEDDEVVDNEEDDEDVEEAKEKTKEEESVEELEEEAEEEDDEEASVETETVVNVEEENTESVDDEVVEASVETETKDEKEKDEEVEEELEIITIDDVDYCVNNEENGFIWEITEDGEQGEKVGYIKDGEPFFYADEK